MGTKATKELYTTLDIMGIYKATPDQWAALQEWEKGNPHMDEWYLTH